MKRLTKAKREEGERQVKELEGAANMHSALVNKSITTIIVVISAVLLGQDRPASDGEPATFRILGFDVSSDMVYLVAALFLIAAYYPFATAYLRLGRCHQLRDEILSSLDNDEIYRNSFVFLRPNYTTISSITHLFMGSECAVVKSFGHIFRIVLWAFWVGAIILLAPVFACYFLGVHFTGAGTTCHWSYLLVLPAVIAPLSALVVSWWWFFKRMLAEVSADKSISS